MRTVICLAILALAAAPVSANLITNGGFEMNLPGTNPPTGWVSMPGTGGNSGVVQIQGDHGIPNSGEGERIYDWVSSYDTTRNGAYIYQQFTQPANTTLDYSVRLLANVVGCGDWSVRTAVRYDPLGGTSIAAATPVCDKWNNYAPVGGWALKTGQITSGASTTGTIFIKTEHPYGCQWNITAVDDMVITPEPVSVLLLLGGLPLLRRRR